MKKIFVICCLLLAFCSVNAEPADSVFKCKVQNTEYNVYLQIDLYHKNITIKGADFLGEMAGYLGDNLDSRKWYFTDAEIIKPEHARLEVINDTGSEDLVADLYYNSQTREYTLKQGSGSTMKIARNRKWKKLPPTLVFK